jgi:hypothetical protein
MVFGIITAKAQAASVSFNPNSVKFTLLPGESGVAGVETNLESTGYCFVSMGIDPNNSQGNLPPSWLMPASVSLATRTGGITSAQMALELIVPADAPAGVYSAAVKPDIERSSEPVAATDITIVVEIPSKCNEMLSIENLQVGPENIWAPLNKEVEIEVSGTVVAAPDCEVGGSYSLETNNGNVAGGLVLDADGNFIQGMVVTVSREGISDGEGNTTYRGLLSVEDEEGNKASREFFVQIDHDRRNVARGQANGKGNGLAKK